MLKIHSEKNTYTYQEKDGQHFINDQQVALDIKPCGDGTYSILWNNKSFTAILEEINYQEKKVALKLNGNSYELSLEEPLDQLIKSMGLESGNSSKQNQVKAPMPGMILSILAKEGDTVEKGDNLLVLEAMKMENMIKSPTNGVVKQIHVFEKTTVEKGVLLIELS